MVDGSVAQRKLTPTQKSKVSIQLIKIPNIRFAEESRFRHTEKFQISMYRNVDISKYPEADVSI